MRGLLLFNRIVCNQSRYYMVFTRPHYKQDSPNACDGGDIVLIFSLCKQARNILSKNIFLSIPFNKYTTHVLWLFCLIFTKIELLVECQRPNVMRINVMLFKAQCHEIWFVGRKTNVMTFIGVGKGDRFIGLGSTHDDVIEWKHFPRYWPFVREIHRSPVWFFFDLRLNKRLSKQSWGWWFETPSRPLWRQCNVFFALGFGMNKTVSLV